MTKQITILLLTALQLSASCLDRSTDIDVGECYEKEGNTNLAQAAYERAILEYDGNVQARLKLAGLYRSMQMQEQAKAVLADVDNYQLTPEQRTSLSAFKTTETESLSSLRARVNLDVGYDSNINISPISDDLITGTLKGQMATLFTRLRADASYLHDLSTVGGWFLRSDANFYYQDNASAHYYDALYGRVYAGAGYRGSNYSLYVPLFYDRLNYLDQDLLQETGIRPDLDMQLSATFLLNLNATYTARRYLQSSNKLRDDDIISAGAGLFWIDGKDMAYLKTRYENYTAINDDPIAFTNKNLYYGSIGGLYSIGNIFDIRLNYQYRYGDFEAVPAGHREDHNHDLIFALERDLLKDLRLQAQYRYVKNSSNYDPATYDKNEMMLGISYNY